jgi:glycosyltransferase involved in cell wall biosynthesis
MLDYDRAELDRLLRTIGAPEIAEKIVLTGYVVNSDLPAIYTLCEAFLYPSLRESFGLPVLEAMACGAPVITSDTSSMPEVAGDAALITDPFSPEKITEAMLRLTSDKSLHDSLAEKGRARASLFSWGSMARNVKDIYSQMSLNPKI